MPRSQAAAAMSRNGNGNLGEGLLRAAASEAVGAASLRPAPALPPSALRPAARLGPRPRGHSHDKRNLGKAYFCPPFPASRQQGLPPVAQLARNSWLTARRTLAAKSLIVPTSPPATCSPLVVRGCHFLSPAPLAPFTLPHSRSCQPPTYPSPLAFHRPHAEAPQMPLPRSLEPSTAILCNHSQ